jgi:hypothetical protein
MRRLALVAAYTAIVLFRAGPASGADPAPVARIHGADLANTCVQVHLACGDNKTRLPPGLTVHTCIDPGK